MRVWLQHPTNGSVVVVVHEDTLTRCLKDGWTVTSDPSAMPDDLPPLPHIETDAEVLARNDAARAAFSGDGQSAGGTQQPKTKRIRAAGERSV